MNTKQENKRGKKSVDGDADWREKSVTFLITWLGTHSYWKTLLAMVALIFAWRIAHHYFP